MTDGAHTQRPEPGPARLARAGDLRVSHAGRHRRGLHGPRRRARPADRPAADRRRGRADRLGARGGRAAAAGRDQPGRVHPLLLRAAGRAGDAHGAAGRGAPVQPCGPRVVPAHLGSVRRRRRHDRGLRPRVLRAGPARGRSAPRPGQAAADPTAADPASVRIWPGQLRFIPSEGTGPSGQLRAASCGRLARKGAACASGWL